MRFIASQQRRRGVALLIVLVALVVTSTALVTLVRVTTGALIDRSLASRRVIADDLLLSGDLAARRWLEEKSALVILPPEHGVSSPGIEILTTRCELASHAAPDGLLACRLTITAWDQCAAVPLALAIEQPDDPIVQTLPRALNDAMGRVPRDAAPSLQSLKHSRDTGAVGDLYPGREANKSIWGWGMLATHNPGPASAPVDQSQPRAYRINVCTAPMPLIAAALEHFGSRATAMHAQIVAARASGRRPNVGSLGLEDARQRWIPEFATYSNCWSIRIDTEVGAARKSWWCVYTRNASTWECVQRQVIDE